MKPKSFTAANMAEYKKLVEQTNVMRFPQNQRRNSQPEKTWKWRVIFKKKEGARASLRLSKDPEKKLIK